MVVYTTNEAGFAAVAERISADRGEPVVTDLDAALASTGNVIYVESPAAISEHALLALQRRLLERGPATGGFGIVTGYTPALAADLYFEETAHSGEDLLLFVDQSPADLAGVDAGTVVEGDDATAAAIAERTDEPLRSFGVSANGRTIHVSLADGFICGAPDSRSVADYPGRQPFCVEDGTVDCPLSDDLVSAESIDAAHVFLLSCSSTVPNATSDMPVLPSMGLLHGADSLLGAYRVSPSWPYELLLHHALLRSGYGLVERCHLLNANSHVNGIMGYPYVAYGHPGARIDDADEPAFETEFEAGDDLRVRLSDVDAYVLDFRVPAALVPDHDERLYVRSETDTDSRLYYLALPDDDGARVLLFAGGHVRSPGIDVVVSGRPARRTDRAIVVDSVRNVARTAAMGFLDSGTEETVQQLRKGVRSLPKRTERERFDATRHAEVGPAVDTLRGQIHSIRDDLLSSLAARATFPMYDYAGSASDDEVFAPDHDCPMCEARPTFVKRVSGWTGEYRRQFCTCPRCGFVYDVPVRGRDAAPSFPVVETDLGDAGVSEPSLTVTFENARDVPVDAAFRPVVIHGDDTSTALFDPQRREAVVPPGERHTAAFDVDPAGFPDNMYYITGVVVANMAVHVGFTTTVVGEKGAYYPGHRR